MYCIVQFFRTNILQMETVSAHINYRTGVCVILTLNILFQNFHTKEKFCSGSLDSGPKGDTKQTCEQEVWQDGGFCLRKGQKGTEWNGTFRSLFCHPERSAVQPPHTRSLRFFPEGNDTVTWNDISRTKTGIHSLTHTIFWNICWDFLTEENEFWHYFQLYMTMVNLKISSVELKRKTTPNAVPNIQEHLSKCIT